MPAPVLPPRDAQRRAHGIVVPSAGAGSQPPEIHTQTHQQIQQQTSVQHLQDPANVRAIQQFLIGHGYHLTVDGIAGPLTKAAIKDWTSGVGRRDPSAFNKMIAGPAADHTVPKAAPNPKAAGTSPAHTGAGAGSGGSGSGVDPMSLLTGMVTTLLKGGSPNQLLGNDLADAAAAPSTTLAQTLQDQLNALPDAKAQALANIENWYGAVKSSEGKAATADQTMATALSDAMKGNATGIASGLGGSAMPGSAQIGAIGANDANTMAAIGASDKALSDQLSPIFDLAAAGAKDARSKQFEGAKTTLQDQLAQALGQANADKANALMQIVGANNNTRQQNFSNEADLLKTLASLQISGMSAANQAQSTAVLNALRASEIAKNSAKTVGGFQAATSAQKAKVAQDITNALLDPNSGKLKSGIDWPTALSDARNIVRTNGWNALDPTVVKTIIAPALGMAGVQFQNPNALFQP